MCRNRTARTARVSRCCSHQQLTGIRPGSSIAVLQGMRLIDRRHDASLAAGLIAGTVVVFQQPLRWLLNIASEVEQRYNLDLIPALVVLSGVFVFHQYRKRQE